VALAAVVRDLKHGSASRDSGRRGQDTS
jgi:hypothetical protein